MKDRLFEMSTKWKDLNIKDRIETVTAVGLIASGVILAFICFIITMTIGAGVLAAIGEMFASGLALFGIGMYVRNSVINMETRVDNKLDEIDDDKPRRKKPLHQ